MLSVFAYRPEILLLRGLGFLDDGSVVFVHDEDGEFADIVEFTCAEGDVVEAAAKVGVAVFEEAVLAIAEAAVYFDIGLG